MNEELTDENFENSLEEFKCYDCGQICKTQTNFDNHKQFHKYYLNDMDQEYCDKCQKNIPKRLFQRHTGMW